jgi:hypothetical protein
MRTRLVATGFLLVAATSAPVAAATVRNLEANPQTVSIVENGKRSEMMLASARKADICLKGCEVMHGTQKLMLKGGEIVSIRDGRLVIQN